MVRVTARSGLGLGCHYIYRANGSNISSSHRGCAPRIWCSISALVLNSDVEEVIKDGRHVSLDIDFLI